MKSKKSQPSIKELEHRFFKLYELSRSSSSYRDKLESITFKIKENILEKLRSNGFEWVWKTQHRMDKKVYAEVIMETQYYETFKDEIHNMVKDNYYLSDDKYDLAIIVNHREFTMEKALYELLTSDFYIKELPSIELAGKLEQKLDTKESKRRVKI